MNKNTAAMDLIIVGGGAAGVITAITAAVPELLPIHRQRSVVNRNKSLKIMLIEAQEEPLKKILATGNGRSNIGNLDINDTAYFSHDSKSIHDFLAGWTAFDTIRFFHKLGLALNYEDERIYPYSMKAGSVREVLLYWLERAKITVKCSTVVDKISYKDNHYVVKTNQGVYFSDKLVLANGGMVQPSCKEIAGSGFSLAQQLGLQFNLNSKPALVPIIFKQPLKKISGLRVRAKVKIINSGVICKEDRGEILFTDYGLSGIPALTSSQYVNVDTKLAIDLFPDLQPEELVNLLQFNFRQLYPQLRVEDWGTGIIFRSLQDCLNKNFLTRDKYLSNLFRRGVNLYELSDKDIGILAKYLQNWLIEIKGTKDYVNAQVSSGGLALSQFNPENLAHKNLFDNTLFAVGEILDLTGDCGGYNLHWAWLCGCKVGRFLATRR